MKKTLLVLLTVITLFTVALLCTACYSFGSGGLLFIEVEEGYAVTGFSGKERFYKNFTVDIPSEYNGQPVTEIADGAFAGYTSLVRVTIPDSVTTINGGAFLGCVLLTEVDIPDSVTFIGDAAFGGCILLEEIYLPDSLVHIDDNVFHDCSSLVNVRIPESVMYIGKDVFAGAGAVAYNEYEDGYYLGNESNPYKALIKVKNTSHSNLTMHSGTSVMQKGLIESCPSLASITFEGGVPAYYDEWGNPTYPYSELPNLSEVTVKAGSVPAYAFTDCTKLTTVVIGDLVESIGSDAFRGCESLSSVTLSGSVTSIGDYAFRDCHVENVYYSGDIGAWCSIRFGIDYANPLYCGAKMYLGNELLTALIIPDTVTSIPAFAFANCQSIKSVVISDSVTDIDIYAFAYCRYLESVDLPDTLTTIGDDAFRDCRSLTAIEIPNSVTSIGINAFIDCEALTSVVLPGAVTRIAEGVFAYCDSLKHVTLGQSVTSIGDRAFGDCSSLQSVEIPDSVISVGIDAFEDTPIKTNVYDNGIYVGSVNNPYHILLKVKDRELDACQIHSDTKVIAGGAFEDCKVLKSIVLPDGVVCIGDSAFKNCEKLSSIHIPRSVTRIERYAFTNCKTLKSIVIPISVTDMGTDVFDQCKSITIYCEASQQSIENKNWNTHWTFAGIPVVWDYTGES